MYVAKNVAAAIEQNSVNAIARGAAFSQASKLSHSMKSRPSDIT
jgi:hypothetical protein